MVCEGLVFEYVQQLVLTLRIKMREISDDVQRNYSLVVTKKFYANFKFLLLINRVFGLFPVSVHAKGDGYMLQWSWLRVIMGNLVVLFVAVLTFVSTLASYSIEKVYNIRVQGLAALISSIAEISILFSTWIVGQLSCSISFKQFWKYVLCLTRTDDILGQPEPSRTTWLLLLISLITLTCLSLDAFMWAKLVIPTISIFEYFWKFLPFYFPYAFAMILQVNFWITAHEIKSRLVKFNGLIVGFMRLPDVKNGIKRVKVVVGDETRSGVKVLEYGGKVFFRDTVLTPPTIKSFIIIYENIAEASMALNNFFGASISVILFNLIICLVITPYVLYQQLFHSGQKTFLFTQSFWMICHILRLMLLVEPYHSAQFEGLKTKKLVTKMLLLDLPEDTLKQVKILLIIVGENKIQFNAKGMMSINRTLFPKIGSAVFTYLAILFQYKNST